MARRSGGGGRSSGGFRSRAPVRNPPKPVSSAPPPAPAPARSPGGGFGAAVADGMAFGTGSAIAHRAVDAVMGPRVIHHETVPSSAPVSQPAPNSNTLADACGGQSRAFQECLNAYGNEISKCQFYMDMLQECRRNSGSSLAA